MIRLQKYKAKYDKNGKLCYISGNLRYPHLLSREMNDKVILQRRNRGVKISININDEIKDTEIAISCNQLTSEVEKIITTLRMLNQQLVVMKDMEKYIIDVADIIYIEAVDRKTFVYTQKEFYESKLKLYEMEERLCESGFFRTSKSVLVQLRHIKSMKNDIDRRIRITLENGEQIIVSRQYAEELKKRLGV